MKYRFTILLCLLGLSQPTFLYAADEKTDTEASKGPQEDAPPAEIYLAAKDGRLNKVKALIAGGADINAVNSQGRSVLMGAVYQRNRRIVRELLMEGADVNTVDALGRTALMIAVSTGDHEIVQMLLDAGADVSLEDKNKNTAISMAERVKDKKLEKLLDAYSS